LLNKIITIQRLFLFYRCNQKVCNLCRIRKIGPERWLAEAGEISKKYFTGKFVVGKGQA